MDIGECHRNHDLALRADYQAASKDREYGYELDVSIFSLKLNNLKRSIEFCE